jgi:pyruvate kinase
VLMLSGETANGKYPLEAVKAMTRIASEAETQRPNGWNIETEDTSNSTRTYFARAAAYAYLDIPVKAIVADSETGRIARLISSYRPYVPIYVKSANIHTVRELSLTYGVYAQIQPRQPNTDQLISQSVRSLLSEGALQAEDVVVVIGGTPGQSGTTNFLVINSVAQYLE